MKSRPRTHSALATAASFGILLVSVAQAQISLTGTSYSENFDGMTTNALGSSATPPGWFVGGVGGTNGAVNGTSVVNDPGSGTFGTNYNYGVAGVNPVTDRALGSRATNAGGTRVTEVRFIVCQTITNLNISYDGEQWGDGGAAGTLNSLTMFFSTNGTTFTAMGPSFTFTSPQDGSTIATLDGNAVTNRVAGIGGNFATNIPIGTTFYLRWIDVNDVSTDDGLAIDNFSLTVSFADSSATNRWTDGSDKWENPCNWSAGTPNITQPFLYITNASSKTVTIDAVTTNTPGSLTISNLTVSAPVNSTNTLRIVNTGSLSLQVLNGLTLLNGGALTVSNANLRVDGVPFGFFAVDGAARLLSGSITVTNLSTLVGAFTTGSSGSLTVSGGTLRARDLRVGELSFASGTFTVAGGTVLLSDALNVGLGGFFDTDVGTVWVTGGQLTVTNGPTILGDNVNGVPGQGQMTVSNGTVTVGDLIVANDPSAAGTLTVAGGTLVANRLVAMNSGATIAFPAGIMTLSGAEIANGQSFVVGGTGQTAVLNLAGTNRFANGFSLGPVANSTGTAWVANSQLTVSNDFTFVGENGVGQMTVSNGAWRAGLNVYVGRFAGSRGTLTLVGGTNVFSQDLAIGSATAATGTVWMTGGQLVVTNEAIGVGDAGVGQMTISNGTCQGAMLVAIGFNSQGTLTVAGGTNIYAGLVLANNAGGTGTVWMTGGRMIVTNSETFVGVSGVGRMTVSNGTWLAKNVSVARDAGSQGTLTVAGGVSSVYSNLTIGFSPCAATGTVNVSGGALRVTNTTATAVLEVRSGTLTQSGGILDIDRLVVTNPCARFIHAGGTLITGLITPLPPGLDADGDGIPNGYEQAHGLDPLNPFDPPIDTDGDGLTDQQEFLAHTDPTDNSSALRIIGISRVGNTVTVTWMGGRGVTNALDSTTGGVGGSYSNNFVLVASSFVSGSGLATNVFSQSGVTNSSLYFRARLVP